MKLFKTSNMEMFGFELLVEMAISEIHCCVVTRSHEIGATVL